MTIREVSEKVGVSAESLRFYEKIGLIPFVPRKESGVRAYDEAMLAYIAFVLELKKTGISLEALTEYMRLAAQGCATIPAQRAIWQETRQAIARKIGQLEACLAQADARLQNCVNDAKLVERNFSALWNAPLRKIS